MIYFATWYVIGLPGAFIARYWLDKGIYDGAPLTRGGLVVCLLSALFGPVTWLAASVWFLCSLGEQTKGFWGAPVFKQEREDD